MSNEETNNEKTIITVLPINYKALEYISWLITDTQNLQNWASNIFRGGFDENDPKVNDWLSAANKSLSEIEDDLSNIKAFLSNIIPPNIN